MQIQSLVWQYDFLKAFPTARQASTRRAELMEIRVATAASCGMVQQQALWEHPPILGSAVCEYQRGYFTLRLRFAVGICDGALMESDNLCAFRIHVNGARLWSTTKQTSTWERFMIDLPSLSGQEIIVQFTTDALGKHQWNWTVWGEPILLGYRTADT